MSSVLDVKNLYQRFCLKKLLNSILLTIFSEYVISGNFETALKKNKTIRTEVNDLQKVKVFVKTYWKKKLKIPGEI